MRHNGPGCRREECSMGEGLLGKGVQWAMVCEHEGGVLGRIGQRCRRDRCSMLKGF